MASIQHGTFKGDIYVETNDFIKCNILRDINEKFKNTFIIITHYRRNSEITDRII